MPQACHSSNAEPDRGATPGRLPVILLGGFLGSGKTTVLSRLLGHERMRGTAVVVNEFGEVALDHLLVAEVDAQTVLLDGGCVCCAVRDDLGETLLAMHDRHLRGDLPELDRIIVETSGLADPTAIAAMLLHDPALARRYVLDTVVVTVDCLHAEVQLEEHPEVRRQVLLADHLLLTKTDLVDAHARRRVDERLHALNPAATRIECVRGDVDPAAILDAGASREDGLSTAVARWHAHSAADDATVHDCAHCGGTHARDDLTNRASAAGPADAPPHGGVQAHCIRIEEPLDWDVVSSWLGTIAFHHGERLLRLKAIVGFRGEDAPVAIHGVRRWLNEPEPLPHWPDADRSSRFVFIVRDLPRMILVKALEAARSDDGGGAGGTHCPRGRFA